MSEIETLELPIFDCLAVSPDTPFLWREQAEIPYPDPYTEYVAAPYLLDARTLKTRWDGIVPPQDIDKLFRDRSMELEREMYQADLLVERGFDASAPDFKKKINNLFVARVMGEIGRIQAMLNSGMTKDSTLREFIAPADENGYESIKYKNLHYTRPLKPREIAQLERVIDEKYKTWRLLTEQATEIREGSVSVEVSVNDAMRAALRRQNPEYARLEAIEQGDGLVFEETGSSGRIIDVTDQTEIH